MKGFVKSYEISIKNNKDPLAQLQNTRKVIEQHVINSLDEMKGLKYVETVKVTFNKPEQSNYRRDEITFEKHKERFFKLFKTDETDEKVSKTAYFNSKAQTIINHTEINKALQLTKQQIMNKIAQWTSEGSGWTIQSVDNHYLNIAKYEPMKGSSYIKLPNELRNSKKGLINMKNDDNECFRWCHIRHINPQEKYPQRIKKADKQYVRKLDYSGVEFPVGVKHYNKIEKQNSININVFGYEDKQPYPIYVSKEKYEDRIILNYFWLLKKKTSTMFL